jgi:hypothetical protein
VAIELFGEAKTLANVPSGDIFSTTLSNGRFARFIKVTGSGASDGVYLGSIAIGPYLEDDRPVQFYMPEVMAPDELVLHESGIRLSPVQPNDPSFALASEPAGQPLGWVALTADDRLLLRFRSHRQTGFVSLEDGRLSNVSPQEIVAYYRHYRLTGPDETGTIRTLFDSARPD